MTAVPTYNATVLGFNANGLVNCKLASGAQVTVRQTGNGELQIGQPLVVQQSGVPGVAGVCFDPSGQNAVRTWPKPEEPTDERCNVWILYKYEGKLWVGGHKKRPEAVIGSNGEQIQLSMSVAAGSSLLSIWGSKEGWEATVLADGLSILGGVVQAASGRRSKLVRYEVGKNYASANRGLFLRKTVTASQGIPTSWENSYETWAGSAGFSTGDGANWPQNGGGGGQTGGSGAFGNGANTLPPPWSNLTSSSSYNFVNLPGPGNSFEETSSSTEYGISFCDGKWAVGAKVVGTRLLRQSSTNPAFEGGSTLYAFATDGAAIIDLGAVKYVPLGFTQQVFQNPNLSNSNLSSYFTFNYPVLTDMGPLTQPDPANPAAMVDKYKHLGLQKKYKLKVYDMTKLAGQNVGKLVAEVQVKAWGIPKDAVVLDVASYLPGAAKYVTP